MSKTKFLKYYPLVKIDEKTHTVTGIATAEEPDCDEEVAVYADTKPEYIEWSNAAAASTKTAGQDISFGNIRIQHGMEVGGKVTALHYDDAEKKIEIETQPIDDAMWGKLKKGFYRGFSHAGSYKYRTCSKCDADMMGGGHYCTVCKAKVIVNYAPVLAEISYVDSPCLKAATFTAVKADGSTEIRKFVAPIEEPKPVSKKRLEVVFEDERVIIRKHADGHLSPFYKEEKKTKIVDGEELIAADFLIVTNKADVSTWTLPVKFSTIQKSKAHVQSALAEFGYLKGVSEDDKAHAWRKLKSIAEEYGIDVSDDNKEKSLVANGLYKGMYQISALADMLSSIRWLQQMCMDESVWEEDPDDAAIADSIGEWLKDGIEILKEIVDEETEELTAKAAEGAGSLMAKTNKARKSSLAAHFDKTAAHHEKMAAQHMDMHKSHMTKADHHEECMGKAEDGDHKENAKFHKGMAAHHEKCAKAHEAHADHCTSMADSQDDETEKTVKTVAAPAATATVEPTTPAAEPTTAVKTETTKEEKEAVEKAAAEAAAVAKAAEVPQSIDTVVGSMMNEFAVDQVKTLLGDLKNNPEIKKLIEAAVVKEVETALAGKIRIDGTKVAANIPGATGITLVQRPGEVNKSQHSGVDPMAVGW